MHDVKDVIVDYIQSMLWGGYLRGTRLQGTLRTGPTPASHPYTFFTPAPDLTNSSIRCRRSLRWAVGNCRKASIAN